MNMYSELCIILKEDINLYEKKCVTKTPAKLKRYFATMHYSAIQEWHKETDPKEKQTLFKMAMLYKKLFLDAANKEFKFPKQKIKVCWTNQQMKPVISRMAEIK